MHDELQQNLNQHARCVRNLATALLGDFDAADDVVQDTLLIARQRPLAHVQSLRSWLLQVARRLAGRRLRGERRRSARERHVDEAAGDRFEAGAAEQVERSEQLRAIAAAIAALPPLQRQAVMMRHFDELPPRRIAAHLGISVEAVESRLRRGHEQLRADLRRFAPGGDERRALLALALPFGGREPVAGIGALATASPPALTLSGAVFMSKSKSFVAVGLLLLVSVGVTLAVAWQHLAGDEARSFPSLESARATDASATPADPAPALGRRAVDEERSEPRPAGAARRVVVAGRVVDETRRPVANCEVFVEVDGAVQASGRSDDDGGFRVSTPAQPGEALRGVVLARDAERCGVETFYRGASATPPGEDVLLVLQRSGALRIRVQDGDRVVAAAEVKVVRGGMIRTGPHVRATCGDDGTAVVDRLPAGRYAIAATAPDGRQVVGIADVLVGQRRRAVLDVASTATVAVEVRSAVDGTPVAGARLEGLLVFGHNVTAHVPLEQLVDLPHTDADGRASLRGCCRMQRILLTAQHPAWRPSWVWDRSVLWRPDQAPHVVIEKQPLAAATWRLVEDEAPVPPDGTRFSVAGRDVPLVDGRLVIDGFAIGSTRIEAYGPDCYAVLDPRADVGPDGLRTASLCRHRRLSVRTLTPDGSPLAGVTVPFFSRGSRHLPRSDADGRAVVDDMLATKLYLYHCGADGKRATRRVDLTAGDAEVELTFAPMRLRARVLINGRAALPGRYRLRCGQWPVTDVVEDVDAGELTFTVLRHDATATFRIHLDPQVAGMAGASAEVVPGNGVRDLELRIGRAFSVAVAVEPPRDGRADIELERWVDDRWQRAYESIETNTPAPLTDLQPGRFRLRDEASEVVGAAVDVGPGHDGAALAIDLSRVVAATGQVSAGDLAGVEIEVRARDDRVLRRCRVHTDGSFRVRAELTEPLLLVAVRGESRSEAITWTGPASGLLLVLPE